jgi:hypothetical protein
MGARYPWMLAHCNILTLRLERAQVLLKSFCVLEDGSELVERVCHVLPDQSDGFCAIARAKLVQDGPGGAIG